MDLVTQALFGFTPEQGLTVDALEPRDRVDAARALGKEIADLNAAAFLREDELRLLFTL